MTFPYSLTTEGNKRRLTAFNAQSDNPIYQTDSSNPRFSDIVAGLEAGDPNVWSLFNVIDGMLSKFTQVTERIAFNGKAITFDGDEIHSVLSAQLQRAMNEGDVDNYTALAKFWEKVEANPNEHSRTQAYAWLASHEFQITEEGDIVGYKYLYESSVPGIYQSGHASQVVGKPSAFVNGKPEPERSVVKQRLGDVVTMPRSEVAHDPREACKRGLHVGTFAYVGAGHRLAAEVHVNPRDVVSVPTDGGGEKVRVCRYYVARIIEAGSQNAPGTSTVLRSNEHQDWKPDVGYRG